MFRIIRIRLWFLVCAWLLDAIPCAAEVYVADPEATRGPDYYLSLLSLLQPGDTLVLPAGKYTKRLNLTGLKGTEAAWITVTGPESGGEAIITTKSACCNVVQLGDTAFVALKNLTVDANSEGVNASIDGISAKGKPTHDILIENCTVTGAGFHQQTAGISTKSTAWNWTVKNNIIEDAGTGAYFGKSNGSAPFVSGVIEGNLFVDSIGYNLQIKHQRSYDLIVGMPTAPRRTVIRHNTFVKRVPIARRYPAKVDGARPNLLVGGFASEGAGAGDGYDIYGNFVYTNLDNESLIQASGRVSIHDNVLVGPAWAGVVLRNHHLPLISADVYNNTIYGAQVGIRVAHRAVDTVTVIGNLVFGLTPISGDIDRLEQNITDTVGNAGRYVQSPSFAIEEMDFYPIVARLTGDQLDLRRMSTQVGYDRDFNGNPKGDFLFRGAYSGDTLNPGWKLNITRKLVAPLASSEGAQEL